MRLPATPEVTAATLTVDQIQQVRKGLLGIPRKNLYHRMILSDCDLALVGEGSCRESVARAYNTMLLGDVSQIGINDVLPHK